MPKLWVLFIFLNFLLTLLTPMIMNIKQCLFLLGTTYFSIDLKGFFLQTVPERSILSYLITSIFGAVAIVFGNTIINQGRYFNQVNELKKLLSSLIDNQVSSTKLIRESLINIRTLLREIHPFLSRKESAERERDKKLIRNFWTNIALLKRTLEKVEKDNLYEKLLLDRKLLKAEASIVIDSYFNKLRSLLIDLETLVLSNFPNSIEEVDLQWRDVELVYWYLDNAITQFSMLICKAEMCNIVLLKREDSKEQILNELYKLINPQKEPFDYQKRELIKLDELKEIDDFISKICRKQKLKYDDLSQLICDTRTEIQAYLDNNF